MSRPVGFVVVVVGLAVIVTAFAGMFAAIAATSHGQLRSAGGPFLWFLGGLAAVVTGRYAIEEGGPR